MHVCSPPPQKSPSYGGCRKGVAKLNHPLPETTSCDLCKKKGAKNGKDADYLQVNPVCFVSV